MKTSAQAKLEAKMRKLQIARKNKQFKFTSCGNVRSSFGMTQNVNALIDKGFLDYNKDVNFNIRKKV